MLNIFCSIMPHDITEWLGYGLDELGFESWQWQQTFNISKTSCVDLEPPSHLFNKYQGSFPGVKWLRHDIDHSHPSRAEVKNVWSYIPTPHIYAFMAWRGQMLPSWSGNNQTKPISMWHKYCAFFMGLLFLKKAFHKLTFCHIKKLHKIKWNLLCWVH
jgi:hypothetical protein